MKVEFAGSPLKKSGKGGYDERAKYAVILDGAELDLETVVYADDEKNVVIRLGSDGTVSRSFGVVDIKELDEHGMDKNKEEIGTEGTSIQEKEEADEKVKKQVKERKTRKKKSDA